ncbi:MAG TPA: 2OG-Fe(II) oxygenase [Rickettsiales bacterium]|nr:2OG-Fe(II) oxygenase [Rickettsiales bacterium]
MLNYEQISATDTVTQPFPYLSVSNVLGKEALDEINRDFPDITQPGIFPLSELKYGPAFTELVQHIAGPRLQSLMEEKFNIPLAGKPLMVTVRGHCRWRDGRIHNDSQDKIVTCLLYLNRKEWNAQGGRLRLLRNEHNINDMIAEVPPEGGNFLAFRRTDNSWHGHAPYEGPRRYIMFNWLASEAALTKNIGRHTISATFKRLFVPKSDY